MLRCTAVQTINLVAREGAQAAMLIPEIAFAIMFCTLFVGGAAMALRTGRPPDATTDETYATADAAAQRARIVERKRLDALIHDNVLSTLLVASHGQLRSPCLQFALVTCPVGEPYISSRHGCDSAQITRRGSPAWWIRR
ncbi:hypothetical protein [Rhodococcus globerulus]|uniref:hypothetical protein n=1 Tax=Rhodococcus globerulus TaxID=33008 RepID=UPI000B84EF22|nr:hypothetical protein [Rhodococcus globerulus]